MTSSTTKKKRNTRGSGSMLEKGGFTTAIGLAFLILPWFFQDSPGIHQIQSGLRLPGWLALGIGLVLLSIHFVRKDRTAKTQGQAGRAP